MQVDVANLDNEIREARERALKYRDDVHVWAKEARIYAEKVSQQTAFQAGVELEEFDDVASLNRFLKDHAFISEHAFHALERVRYDGNQFAHATSQRSSVDQSALWAAFEYLQSENPSSAMPTRVANPIEQELENLVAEGLKNFFGESGSDQRRKVVSGAKSTAGKVAGAAVVGAIGLALLNEASSPEGRERARRRREEREKQQKAMLIFFGGALALIVFVGLLSSAFTS